MKNFKINYRLQKTSARTSPIQLILSLGTKDEKGKYIQLFATTKISIMKSDWLSKLRKPKDSELENTLLQLGLFIKKELTKYESYSDYQIIQHKNTIFRELKELINYKLYGELTTPKAEELIDDDTAMFFGGERILQKLKQKMNVLNIKCVDSRGVQYNISDIMNMSIEDKPLITEPKTTIPESLQHNFSPTPSNTMEFYKYCEQVGKDKMANGTLSKLAPYTQLSKDAMKWNDKLMIHQVNDDLMQNLISWIKDNTTSYENFNKRKKTLKAVLRVAKGKFKFGDSLNTDSELYKPVGKSVSIKRMKSPEHIYLNEKQLQTLIGLEFTDEEKRLKLDYVRDLYCCASYLGGLRISDWKKLFNTGKTTVDGEQVYYVETVSQKTGEHVKVPILDSVYKILSKYPEFKPLSDATINKKLKLVGKKASEVDSTLGEEYIMYRRNIKNNKVELRKELFKGEHEPRLPKVYELITAHSARRNFCTNFYYGRKIDALTLCAFSGHSDVEEFMNYVKINEQDKFDEFAKRVVLAERNGV